MTCNQSQANHFLSQNMVSSVQKPSLTKCSQEATNMAGRTGVCNIASNLSKSVANTRNKLHARGGSNHQKNGIVVVSKCSANSMQQNSSWHSSEYKPSLPPKTEGGHTSDQSSLTNQSNSKRLVCPELAISYTNTLISSRVGRLCSRQHDVEDMLSSLKKKLRLRQLNLVHAHTASQVESHKASPKSCRKSTTSESTVSVVSPTELVQYESIEPMDSTPVGCTNQTLPLQVDGACDDAFVVKTEGDEAHALCEKKQTPSITGESFCSMDSLESIQSDDVLLPSVTHIRQRLRSLEATVDGELTESSSDEEEEEDQSAARWRREGSKQNWERIKTSIGTRWSWLEHQIAALNKELCRLDHEIQRCPSKEKFTFAAPPNSSHPSYFALPNGSFLDHLHKGGNGSLVSAAASGLYKGVVAGRPSNGFGHSIGGGAPSHCLPHLLLPDNLLGSKLQVKDLLSPSPLGRNFVFIDEGGYTSARTRPLERRAHRKIVRRPKVTARRETSNTCDPSEHPKLTLPHELPSRILLDRAIKRITEEHSYAQLPLSKRRKAAPSLSHLSTSRQLSFTPRYDYSFSTSPSPIGTPLSAGSLDKGKGSSRKKPQLVHHHSTSSTELQSPWSPNMSRPSTPTMTPLQQQQQHPKRKRMLSSTPSYDIDNIVIPYSMASSTRLEKPEYKEIVTPNWREVVNGKDTTTSEEPMDLNSHGKSSYRLREIKTPVLNCTKKDKEDCEDLSDQLYSRRHEKCELQEKKRFINFISGGQRKRSRPQSLSSTPDGSTTFSSHPLSASKGKHPHKRVLTSPPPLEGECMRRNCGVLPWLPREFPLSKTDEDALYNPPPPPKPIRITPSPSPMHTRSSTPTDFKTPSSTSTLATPLSSPLSTPSEESRVISPVEWMVINSQLHNGNHIGNVSQKHSDSSLPSSSIILKLAKRN